MELFSWIVICNSPLHIFTSHFYVIQHCFKQTKRLMLESNQKKTKSLERGKTMEIDEVGEKASAKKTKGFLHALLHTVCFSRIHQRRVNVFCNRRHSQMEDF